ncbi:hypothetical protein P5F24_04260 [Clostridium perfringens]|nr:hypothetical protein [Clostridium perfringens]
MKDEGEVVISIDDFVDPIMDYYQYIGKKVKVCESEGCNKRILIKNNKNKYCKECAKKENIRKTLKNRKSLK